MKNAAPCCQDPATLANGPSPFARIIALGFYDGPTSGILQCQACASVYKFDMLDWSEDHNIRVFRLAALPPGALNECLTVLSPLEPPRWPVWAPPRSRYASADAAQDADQELEAIVERAQPAKLIVAWNGYGERILAAKKVAAGLEDYPDWFARDSDQPDWLAFLGIDPNVRLQPS